jgi:hypothetical protein
VADDHLNKWLNNDFVRKRTATRHSNTIRSRHAYPSPSHLHAMGLSQLPQEIIDDIIGHVSHSGEDALSNCALVSRAFRPQAQRLRFSDITLDHRRPDMFARLGQVLVHNPTVGECVRTVRLVYPFQRDTPSAGDHADTARAVDMLEHVLRACHTQTLMITYGFVPQQAVQLFSSQNLPHLRSLELGKMSSMDVNIIHQVLALLPPLNQLELWAAHIYTKNTPRNTRREPIHVNRLYVMVDRAPVDNNWTLGNVYNVKEELVICVYAPWALECAAPINKILQAWGSTPRRLRVEVYLGVMCEF